MSEVSENVCIGNCERGDLAAVMDIEQSSFDDPYPLSILQTLLELGSTIFRLGWSKRVLAGYCLSSPVDPSTFSIMSLAVRESERRKGVGTLLLQDTIGIIRQKVPFERIVLQVSTKNIPAQKLYEKLGFETKGTIDRYYDNGDDAFLMEYAIPRDSKYSHQSRDVI